MILKGGALKAVLGVTAGAIVALGIVFWLLLETREDLGKADQALAGAEASNQEYQIELDGVIADRDGLLESIEREREARRLVQADLHRLGQQHRQELEAAERRITDATNQLTGHERDCADSYIPQSLIDSLHTAEGDLEAGGS